MLIRRPPSSSWLLIAFAALVGRLAAEDIVYPADSGVIDVTKPPYSARGDGLTDNTEAIQQALLEHGNTNRIIYLPNGIYRISGTLRWPGGESQGRTILQGQSREKTVIQLLDYTPSFGNAGRPIPLIWTGASGENLVRNAVRNLTIHTGVGNPGTIGLQFLAHRQGAVRDVDIIAGGDGAGATGLDLSHSETMGPLLVKNLRVRGFDTGIRAANPVYSVTFEHIEVTGQKLAGVRNSAQVLTFRDFRSTNSVPALQNLDGAGFVTLIDGVFQGLPARRPGPAVVNRGILLARSIMTPGYTNAVENRAGHGDGAPGPEVNEYLSHDLFALFPAPPFTLNLPVEETPQAPWDAVSDWASPAAFGGKGDGTADDTEAFQKAVDSGATTLYLPKGTWTLRGTVELRGRVRRIVGLEGQLAVATPPGQPGFRMVDSTAPILWFDGIEVESARSHLVELAGKRQLVFVDCIGVSFIGKAEASLFLEDVATSTSWELAAGQTLWARQWCQEFQGQKLVNRGGQAWVLGYSTKRAGILAATLAGGKTEILGGLCFANGGLKAMPMFRIDESSASITIAEASFTSTPYQVIVEETRNGVLRRMSSFGLSGDHALPQRIGGIAVPLFTGYFGVGAVEPRTTAPKNKTSR